MVGIPVADPNAALGTPERLRAVMAQAGSALASFGPPLGNSRGQTQARPGRPCSTVMGDELRAIDPTGIDKAREHFLDAWRSVTDDRATDSQEALLALAGTVGSGSESFTSDVRSEKGPAGGSSDAMVRTGAPSSRSLVIESMQNEE